MRCEGGIILILSFINLALTQDNLYLGELSHLKGLKYFIYIFIILGNVDGKLTKCLTCRVTVEEIIAAQAKVDPKKKAEVKSGRFMADGTQSGNLIEFRKSEQYLTELFEGDDGICKTMDDYAKAKYKTNGELTVLKMMTETGMNPLMSAVDFVQDQDLNKSLKHYCLEVLDEFDEVFLDYFMADSLPDDVVDKICVERSKLCKAEQDDDEHEEENYLPEKEL